MLRRICQVIALVLFFLQSHSQLVLPLSSDSLTIQQLPADYLDKVSSKANQIEQKLENKTDRALARMMKSEAKMKKKLAKIDSLKAVEIFGNIEGKYKQFEQKLQNGGHFKKYLGTLDTLATSVKFLDQNRQLISNVKGGEKKVKEALEKVNGLEGQFNKAEELKKILNERRQYLQEQLNNLGFAKQLKKLNKQVYYYSEQVNEYKALLKDHKKAEKKAIELLSKTKLFKDFMQKNGMVASLFPMPGNPDDPSGQISLSGLQTRAQVDNMIRQQVAAAGPNGIAQFRDNLQEAQNKLNELKDKVSQLGAEGGAGDIPEGFKPNSQKTKSIFQRIEYGTNIQTQRAGNLFPATSDLGLWLGYKMNEKSVIGIGASYKMGLGTGWDHLRFTSEGMGLRSFIDWKIKASLWISGGYEQNYKARINSFSQLKDYSEWQQSGLIGVSKIVSMKTKFFKKTKIQLMWDFLSYQQIPRTQPVLFRIGYTIK
jgi:hypothetical protein